MWSYALVTVETRRGYQGLELQAVVSHSAQELRTEVILSARAVCTVTCRVSSPILQIELFFGLHIRSLLLYLA